MGQPVGKGEELFSAVSPSEVQTAMVVAFLFVFGRLTLCCQMGLQDVLLENLKSIKC